LACNTQIIYESNLYIQRLDFTFYAYALSTRVLRYYIFSLRRHSCLNTAHATAMAKRRRMRNEQPAEDLLEMCSSQIGIFACAGMAQLIVEFASANLFELHSFWSLSKDCNKQVQNFVQKLFTTGALFLYPCAFKMLPYMPGYDCSFVYRALEFQGAALLQNWSLWMGIGHKRIRPCYIDRFTSFAFVSKDLEDDSYSEDSFAGREEGFFLRLRSRSEIRNMPVWLQVRRRSRFRRLRIRVL
jgi:hypothetical protein